MQAAGGVLLNNETQAGRGVRLTADWLGRFVEVALAFVFFEAHGLGKAKPQATGDTLAGTFLVGTASARGWF